MIKLPNLSWTPAWTSVVGCIHGALKFLEIAPDISWLFGATGHAFLINMSRDGSCPSGPTAWKTPHFYDLGSNIGYQVNGTWGDKRQPDFPTKQRAAWELTRSSLDQGFPVVGWELAIPEFYVVTGYDDRGYYFNGPGEELGPSPKPWNELGQSEIGMLEMVSIQPIQGKEAKIQIQEALEFALAFNAGAPEWVLPDYLAGQDAYQVWIDALKSGEASLMGHAYNTAVWSECRHNGTVFLKTAKNQLKGQLDETFDQAIQVYGEVAFQLREITELYPFFENNRSEPVGQNPRSEKAAQHLVKARTAEAEGLDLLKAILKEL